MFLRKKKKPHPSQPFAGYMMADEQILWMDGPLAAFTTQRGPFYTLIAAVCLMAFVILDMSRIASLNAALIWGLLCAGCVILCGLLISSLHRKNAFHDTYAVTNKHLFYRTEDEVSEIALEDVPPMHLVLGEGSQGTLSFDGDDFPPLPNIDDAAYVKTLIEQAQRQRREIRS